METFNIGDRVIFRPIYTGQELKATVTEVHQPDEFYPTGTVSIRIDEDVVDEITLPEELTKTAYVSLDTLLDGE